MLHGNGEAGLIIIGDELLCGKRRDRHFDHVMETLTPLGWHLAWSYMVGDDSQRITHLLKESMAESLPVFCFGGIGATPDDVTRQCAAVAAEVPLVRHPQAVAEIEMQFGAAAYPNRIRMAVLPAGCAIIPNPVNHIPGFTLNHHHFFPGFPDMAWPMMDWVLEHYYGEPIIPLRELAVWIFDVPESELLGMLEVLTDNHPKVKLYSLPHLKPHHYIELGVRGKDGVEDAFSSLQEALEAAEIPYEVK